MDHISSGSFQAWRTPRALAAELVREYNLTLDAAADRSNTVCPVFFDGSEGSDGLLQPWDVPDGGVWVNPPYENMWPWLEKAMFEVEAGRCERVVMLVPASVGVGWFTWAVGKCEVHFFDERIKFQPPPIQELPFELQERLYKDNGTPKSSPGGGNALLIIEKGGLRGCTGLRSSKTGRFILDFIDGSAYPA